MSASAIGLHSEPEKRSKRPGLAWQKPKNAKLKNIVNLNIAQFKVDWVIFRVVSENLLRLKKMFAPVNQKLGYRIQISMIWRFQW